MRTIFTAVGGLKFEPPISADVARALAGAGAARLAGLSPAALAALQGSLEPMRAMHSAGLAHLFERVTPPAPYVPKRG